MIERKAVYLRLKSYKKENGNKGALFFLNKQENRRRRTGIVLLFILFVLFCLDGMAYVNCKSIFPDEIMDVHGYLLSSLSENELPLYCKARNESINSAVTDIYMSCILYSYKIRVCFSINNQYLSGPKERLFTFHRYKSWNSHYFFPIQDFFWDAFSI